MFHCVGCGRKISWDGKGLLSLTCYCNATIFMADKGKGFAFPTSVFRQIAVGAEKPTPHLDDLVGTSDHTSAEKTEMIKFLQEQGFIWMEECVECRLDGTYDKYQRRKAARNRYST